MCMPGSRTSDLRPLIPFDEVRTSEGGGHDDKRSKIVPSGALGLALLISSSSDNPEDGRACPHSSWVFVCPRSPADGLDQAPRTET